MGKRSNAEAAEHRALATYTREKYPDLIFNTDSSGIRLTEGQAVQMKQLRSENSFPDLVFYHRNSKYNGLFIELKATGKTVYKKNGELKRQMRPIYQKGSNRTIKIGEVNHLEEQKNMLNKLIDQGFYATFAIGLQEAIDILDNYMKIE